MVLLVQCCPGVKMEGRVVRFSVRFSSGRLDAEGAACSADLAAGILLGREGVSRGNKVVLRRR